MKKFTISSKARFFMCILLLSSTIHVPPVYSQTDIPETAEKSSINKTGNAEGKEPEISNIATPELQPTSLETAKPSDIALRADDLNSWMPDVNLQQLVANQLGLSSVDQITKELLTSTGQISLDASDPLFTSVTDLTGLEYFNDISLTSTAQNIFSQFNFSNYPDIMAKMSLNLYSDLTNIFPSGIDFSTLSGFKNVGFDPHNTYNPNIIVNLDQNNYSSFFLTFDEMKIFGLPLSHITSAGAVYINVGNNSIAYETELQSNGILFTLNPNQSVDYSSMLAGTSFSNSDTTIFPDGPYSQLGLSGLNSISGYINLCFSLNYAPMKQAGENVTVKYVDENNNNLLDNVVLSGDIGDTFTTEKKIIDGYTFKEVIGDVNGTFTDQPQTITYVYTKDPVSAGNVTVKYVDENNNNLLDNIILSGNIGDAFTTEKKIIDGYTFKEVIGDANGTFTDQPQTITYVYTKDPVSAGDITVKYVDENNNSLLDNIILSGNIGDAFTTEKKIIDGYTFKEVIGDVNGTFTDQPQTITYIYTKNPVHHITTSSSNSNTTNIQTTNSHVKSLPQTGENSQGVFEVLGLLISVSAALFIFFKRK
ncbi:MucBP domain-containing protein [Lactococcus garvieae]